MRTKHTTTLLKWLGVGAISLALVVGLLYAVLNGGGASKTDTPAEQAVTQMDTTAEQAVTQADGVDYTLSADLHLVTAEQFASWYMENMASAQPVTIHTEKGQASETAAISNLTIQTDPAQDWETAAKNGSGMIRFDLALTLPDGYVQPDAGDITATLTVTIEVTQTTPNRIVSVTANGNTSSTGGGSSSGSSSSSGDGSSTGGGSSSGGDSKPDTSAEQFVTKADDVTYTLDSDRHFVTAEQFTGWYMENMASAQPVTIHTEKGQASETAAIRDLTLQTDSAQDWETAAKNGSGTIRFDLALTLPDGYVQPDTGDITATLTVTIEAAQTKILTISSVAADTEDPTAALTVTLSEAVASLQATNFTISGTGSATVDSVSTSDSGKSYTLNLSGVKAGKAQVSLTGVEGYTYSAEGSQATVTLTATPVTEVTVSVKVQDSNPIPTEKLTVTLNPAIPGLTASNFIVTGTGSAMVGSVSTSDSGKTYTLTLSGVTAGEASVGLQNLPKGYKMAETGNSPTVTLRQVATAITNITQTAANGGVTAAGGRQLRFAISQTQIAKTVEAGVDLGTAFAGVSFTKSFSATYPTFEYTDSTNHNNQYLLVVELEDDKVTRFGQEQIQDVPFRYASATISSENRELEGLGNGPVSSGISYAILEKEPDSAQLNQITTSSSRTNVQTILSINSWTGNLGQGRENAICPGKELAGKYLFVVWWSYNNSNKVYGYACVRIPS